MSESEALSGFGTLLQRSRKACAYLVTGEENHAVLWTAVPEGLAGENISVAMLNPGGAGLLVVTVPTALHVVVTLARTGGTITSTAKQVIAAVKVHTAAHALVHPANSGTSTGMDVVDAEVETALDGASDTVLLETVAEVGQIGGISISLGTTECTHLTSPEAFREHLATVLDTGEITLGIRFTPAANSQSYILGLLKDISAKFLRGFKLIWTDAEYWTFSGYCTKFSPSGPVEGALGGDVTIKVTGVPVLTHP